MEPTTGCENDHYYRDYATGGKNIVAFLKKGAERGSENRDQNFQICINSSGTITEFLNGWDSTPKYSNDSKDDAFRDFLTANPEIIQAIQGKDPFKNCGAIVKAQQLKQYLHEPFVLDGEDKIFALQTNSALIYAISEVIVKIKKIPAFAFAGSPSLRKITLEPGVEVIGAAAFVNCLNISTIVLPEGLQKIEYKAFSGCTGLKGSVRLPDSVTEIQTYAFAGTHIKLAINKERKEKLKVDINDADWYKSHAKGILIR